MQTHYRTRQGNHVRIRLRDGTQYYWRFLQERNTVIEFVEGTLRKVEIATFVPLSKTKCRERVTL